MDGGWLGMVETMIFGLMDKLLNPYQDIPRLKSFLPGKLLEQQKMHPGKEKIYNMELEGRVWKIKNHWLVEVPSLNIMTQGKTKKEALFMIKDAIFEFILYYFETEIDKKFEITVLDHKDGTIGITSNDNKVILALSLRKQREMSGSTIREASERLGSKSPNAYAQYERGRYKISLDQYEKLLYAANPFKTSVLRII